MSMPRLPFPLRLPAALALVTAATIAALAVVAPASGDSNGKPMLVLEGRYAADAPLRPMIVTGFDLTDFEKP